MNGVSSPPAARSTAVRSRPVLAVMGTIAGPDPTAALHFDFDVRKVCNEAIDVRAEAVLLIVRADGASGVVRTVRTRTGLPIVALIDTDDLRERVGALESGADDIIAQPHHPAELRARLRAVLRRAARSGADVIRVADLEILPRERIARRAGKSVPLTPNEFALLCVLVAGDGGVTREQLADRVWGGAERVSDATIHTTMSHLRSKLRDLGIAAALRSVRNRGYRFDPRRCAAIR